VLRAPRRSADSLSAPNTVWSASPDLRKSAFARADEPSALLLESRLASSRFFMPVSLRPFRARSGVVEKRMLLSQKW